MLGSDRPQSIASYTPGSVTGYVRHDASLQAVKDRQIVEALLMETVEGMEFLLPFCGDAGDLPALEERLAEIGRGILPIPSVRIYLKDAFRIREIKGMNVQKAIFFMFQFR